MSHGTFNEPRTPLNDLRVRLRAQWSAQHNAYIMILHKKVNVPFFVSTLVEHYSPNQCTSSARTFAARAHSRSPYVPRCDRARLHQQ